MFRKFMSMVLALCVVGMGTTIALASDLPDQSEVTDVAEALIISALGDRYATLEPGQYSISDPIPTYLLNTDGISSFNEAIYYVVYCNDEPVAMLTLNGANTNAPTYSLSEDFVKNLDEVVLNQEKNYALVMTDSQVYAVTEEQVTEIAEYDLEPVSVNNISTLASEEFKVETYNTDEIFNVVTNSKDIELAQTEPSKSLTINQTRAYPHSIQVAGTINPYYQKSGENCCWAVGAWCIGECLNPQDNEVIDCITYCDKVLGNGGNDKDQIKILDGMYDLNPESFNYQLSYAEMENLIDYDEPFTLNCTNTKNGSKLGHTLTCYGYNKLDRGYEYTTFAVMDSFSPTWKWMVASKNEGKLSITSAGVTYEMSYTVTPNGKR